MSAQHDTEGGDSRTVEKSAKTRLLGACDQCRKKKARCDCSEMPDNVCSNCIIYKVPCSHDAPRQTRTWQNQMQNQRQIQTLQERLERLKAHIRKCYPDEDMEAIMSRPLTEATERDSTIQSTSVQASASITEGIFAPNLLSTEEVCGITDEEDLAHVSLEDHLVKNEILTQGRFFGQSSTFMFAKHASMVRSQVQESDENDTEDHWKHRRHPFWMHMSWESEFESSPKTNYVYPPDDLMMSLVSLYFERLNYIIPVLHEPTFMECLLARLHHSYPPFGMTVLIVCALGSRYSQDKRVMMTTDLSGLSAGWNYFCQVPVFRNRSLFESTTYDLQYYALASMYLIGTALPNASWIFLGMGMRFALEKGVHRRKGDQMPSAEVELQKRAFWAIVCLDRLGSAFVGRPYGYPHETFDVEYPIECDDIYWETDDPSKAFQQPPGQPSSISAFVALIKLCDILAFTLRTLYANKKSRVSSGFVGNDWEVKMVAELDSSTNRWKDSLPEHLKWDSENQSPLFFHQSATLYAQYYYVQIQIHRPFLSRNTSLSFVSLAMCTNAARSISHILERMMEKGPRIIPCMMVAAFTAGIFIVMGLKNGPHTEYTHWNPTRDKENFKKCVDFLRKCEDRWHCAGRLNDMLLEAVDMNESQSSSTRMPQQNPTHVADWTYSSAYPSTNTSFPEPTMTVSYADNTGTESDPLDDWELQQLFLRELGSLTSFGFQDNLTDFAGGGMNPGWIGPPQSVQSYGAMPLGQNFNGITSNANPDALQQFPQFENIFTQSMEDLEMYLATAGQI